MTQNPDARPPFPPFDAATAAKKVRAAEDGWNRRNPAAVALAYSPDTRWRNRGQPLTGREAVIAFLATKWETELEYRLVKDLWAFEGDRIAVRFKYEYHDASGQWFRAHGNENWCFDEHGLMKTREASINDSPIAEADRRLHWPVGEPRPADHPGFAELFPELF